MAEATHEPPMSKAMSLLAHSIPLLMVLALTARALWLLKLVPPGFGLVDAVASFALIAGVISLAFHLRFGGLCLRCIRNTPTNPELAVNRNKFFLWTQHWPNGQFWKIYGGSVLILFIGDTYTDGVVQLLCKLPLDVTFFSLMWATWQHHRLQPWCPYCRGWDEGGEEEVVPDPDPAETKRA
jgi:hypothetical protein